METLDYYDLEQEVELWAEARGIYENSNSTAQALKTLEEVQELLMALHVNDKEGVIDALGDIVVTLISVAKLEDVLLDDCLQTALDEIQGRHGMMIDGVFIKETNNDK